LILARPLLAGLMLDVLKWWIKPSAKIGKE
jgi:hypothetical protein